MVCFYETNGRNLCNRLIKYCIINTLAGDHYCHLLSSGMKANKIMITYSIFVSLTLIKLQEYFHKLFPCQQKKPSSFSNVKVWTAKKYIFTIGLPQNWLIRMIHFQGWQSGRDLKWAGKKILLFERYEFYKYFLLHKHKLIRFSGHVSLIEPYQQPTITLLQQIQLK